MTRAGGTSYGGNGPYENVTTSEGVGDTHEKICTVGWSSGARARPRAHGGMDLVGPRAAESRGGAGDDAAGIGGRSDRLVREARGSRETRGDQREHAQQGLRRPHAARGVLR